MVVSLWRKDLKVSEERFTVSVRKRALPRLRLPLPLVEPVSIKAGESRVLNFELERQGNNDAIEVKLEDLPAKVWCRAVVLLPAQNAVDLSLGADLDAAPVTAQRARLTLWIKDTRVHQQQLLVTVAKPPQLAFITAFPSRLPVEMIPARRPIPTPMPLETLPVKVGDSLTLRIQVARNGCTEKIDLLFEGLPAGIKPDPASIAGEVEMVSVAINVPAEAQSGRWVFRVRGQVRAQQLEAQAVILTIEKAGAAVNPQPRGVAKSDLVSFETVDGVRLVGAYYASNKGVKAPCVLLLHDFDQKKGGHSQTEEWTELAGDLQWAGYAVLSFDFRGFGQSTTVGKEFWLAAHNAVLPGARGPKLPTSITQAKFPAIYYRQLVNDVAAAKAYLDNENDAQQLNCRNLIVIGAGQAATIGMMWLDAEFQRHKAKVVPVVPPVLQAWTWTRPARMSRQPFG